MATPHLIAVPDPTDKSAAPVESRELVRVPETASKRIRRLQDEARALAREQIDGFVAELVALAQQAGEIAEGGEAYPVGVREVASRFADEAIQRAQTIATITGRTP